MQEYKFFRIQEYSFQHCFQWRLRSLLSPYSSSNHSQIIKSCGIPDISSPTNLSSSIMIFDCSIHHDLHWTSHIQMMIPKDHSKQFCSDWHWRQPHLIGFSRFFSGISGVRSSNWVRAQSEREYVWSWSVLSVQGSWMTNVHFLNRSIWISLLYARFEGEGGCKIKTRNEKREFACSKVTQCWLS